MADSLKELSVFISPCPNDTFTFGGMIQNKIDWLGPKLNFSFLDIQNLNEAGLSDNKPDVLKFSYALLPKLNKWYDLCPIGSALGVGVGPLLIGSGNVNLKDREIVYIPGKDTTATLLTKRYLPEGPKLKVLPYHEIMNAVKENENCAGVIIHESRFAFEEYGLKILLDLGKKWEEETQGPLPLGGVLIKRSLPEPMKKIFVKKMRDSLLWARENEAFLEPLLKKYAQELSLEVIAKHIQLYVNDYTLNLGKTGTDAIKKLCNMNDLNLLND